MLLEEDDDEEELEELEDGLPAELELELLEELLELELELLEEAFSTGWLIQAD
ncbi:MAG: hypothetical protein RL497_2170, partial [Pseudomonadota bacterium]